MITKPKFFIYLSKNKIDMLYGQLLRKGFKFSDISPKFAVPGFEAGFTVKGQDEPQTDLYIKAQKILTTLEKTESIKFLQNQEPYIKFYNQDRGKWHCGVLSYDFFGSFNEQDGNNNLPNKYQQSIEGAYINFKIHRDSLILLISSSNHFVGESNYHLDPSLPSPIASTTRLLFSVPQFIKEYERRDYGWASRSAPIRLPSSSLGYCLSLSEICLKKFIEYPESEIEILFMIYQKFDLRKTARELSRGVSEFDLEIMQTTRRWLESKVSKTDMLKFRYLYIGSPIYTAL